MKKSDILKAVSVLRAGGLVALPTETVYGLGADARNPDALRKIFLAKGRPFDHPLIVHLANVAQLSEWAREIPEKALILAKHFWPGPLTLILKKSNTINDIVTGSQDTIGLRIPNHPVALALLEAFGNGIAAPSANRFGRISPTTAKAVREELGDRVDLILEGGQCEVGLESTIVDMTHEHPVILRPGMISQTQIENVLHESCGEKEKNSPRVSGSLETHYAPTTKTRLMTSEQLGDFLKTVEANDLPVAILAFQSIKTTNEIHVTTMPRSPTEYAHDLYFVLRELDKKQFKQIIIQTVPELSEWDAIRDRLQKAAGF